MSVGESMKLGAVSVATVGTGMFTPGAVPSAAGTHVVVGVMPIAPDTGATAGRIALGPLAAARPPCPAIRVYSDRALVPPGATDVRVIELGWLFHHITPYVRRGTVDLRDIRFIHTLSEGRASALVAEKVGIMRERLAIARTAHPTDWQDRSDEILPILLRGDKTGPDSEPLFCRVSDSEPLLSLNGHRRLASLSALAVLGEIPVDWLRRIPHATYDLLRPEALHDITAGVTLSTAEVFGEIEVEGCSPATALTLLESYPRGARTIRPLEMVDVNGWLGRLEYPDVADTVWAPFATGEVQGDVDVLLRRLLCELGEDCGDQFVQRVVARPEGAEWLWAAAQNNMNLAARMFDDLHTRDADRLRVLLFTRFFEAIDAHNVAEARRIIHIWYGWRDLCGVCGDLAVGLHVALVRFAGDDVEHVLSEPLNHHAHPFFQAVFDLDMLTIAPLSPVLLDEIRWGLKSIKSRGLLWGSLQASGRFRELDPFRTLEPWLRWVDPDPEEKAL